MSDASLLRGQTPAQLDAQYDNSARVPEFPQIMQRWQQASHALRSQPGAHLDLAFGSEPIQTLDFFEPLPGSGWVEHGNPFALDPAAGDPAAARSRGPAPRPPLWIFIHGGYWQWCDKHDFSFVAAGLRAHGAAVAVINYGLAPGYRMDAIVAHVRMASAWLGRHAAELGADPARLYACGHSAGAHLATMLLAGDRADGPEAPSARPSGVCAISGLYDLEPIRRTRLNDALAMSPEEAERNSPVYRAYPRPARLSLLTGALESDEFAYQQQAMATTWQSRAYPLSSVRLPGMHHFNVIDGLGDPGSWLVAHQLHEMREAFAA